MINFKNPAVVSILFLLFRIGYGQQPEPIPTGLLFVDPNMYQSIPLASTPLMGELPESADLSSRFPTPGHQGQQASCVGWAVAYALKSYQEAVERNWSPNSIDRLFSPAFIYNQIKMSPDCRGGTSYVEALNLLRRDGIATLSDFPYQDLECTAIPNQYVKQNAKQYAIADWRRVNVQDETEIKNHIAAGFPVLFGMIVDRAFYNHRGAAPYSHFSGENMGGHAMVVVGYDNRQQAFKIMNSWGTEWGDGGFGWITYSAFKQAVREGYVAQDIVTVRPNDPTPSPQPSPVPIQPPAPPAVVPGVPQVQYNVMVNHPGGLVPGIGMNIQLPGTVTNAAGKTLQIVIRFAFQNGVPIYANPREMYLRDVTGLVATGTTPIPLLIDNVDLINFTMSIPYYALNLQATNGMMNYQLQLNATVYLDNFPVAQSASVPFFIRW